MNTPGEPEKQPSGGDRTQHFTQEIQFSNVGARVPEKVARGVFATGAFVLQGPTEFVIDFVLRMNKPHQIVARVFLPMTLVPQIIETLKTNLDRYRHTHGAASGIGTAHPAAAPAAAPAAGGATAHPAPPAGAASAGAAHHPVNVEEVYGDLKMSEDVMVGVYANALLVVHNATDFCLEFIANLYPRAVVTSRVFLSAPQVPILLTSITQAWHKLQTMRHQQPPPAQPPA